MFKTAIITVAGLGSRMLPFSKEVPKEMLPIVIAKKSRIYVVPVLHYIFDSLYESGFRRFYLVVGRGKRVLEDYFTPDWNYIEFLERMGRNDVARFLASFYKRIEECELVMVNQPQPKGFGDAVLRTKTVVTDKVFLVHAGDDIVYPNHSENIKRLIDHYIKHKPKVVFLYEESQEPEKYGVITGTDHGSYVEVDDVIEKPTRPISNRAIVAVYIFDQDIYYALGETKPLKGEHQLTDAIRYLVKSGEKVHAVKVSGHRLDLGSPETYIRALKILANQNLKV